MIDVQIEEGWKNALHQEFSEPYFAQLVKRVRQAYQTGNVYPKAPDLFRAFNMCPYNQVRVVILGQDPYHGPGQANGLSFSVPAGVPLPPSLRNIFQEMSKDLGVAPPKSGDLSHWASQGVLLLNASLTVEAHKPMSHANIGWHVFTDNVIRLLSQQKENLVFVLWGSFAARKESLISAQKHLILKAPHPSPLSAHRGFFGSKPFSKTNYYLLTHHKPLIRWEEEHEHPTLKH